MQEPTKVGEARQVGAGRRLRRLMLGAGVVLAVSCSGYALVGGVTPVTVVAGQLVVAATFVATGFMAAARRPQNRTGTLMMVTGLALLVDLLQGPPLPALSIIGVLGGTVSGIVLVYLIVAYPSGEIRSSAERTFIVVSAALLGITNLGRLAAFDPVASGLAYDNPYQVIADPRLVDLAIKADVVSNISILLALLVILAHRWAASSPLSRRILAPVLVPSTLLVVVVIASIAVDASSLPDELKSSLSLLQVVARAAVPVGFLIGLLRTRMARSAVADLVVELGAAPSPARLRGALADALGDRTLSVAYWAGSARGFVDDEGRSVVLPTDDEERAVTVLDRDEQPVAALIHDRALLDDPALVASVASAMRLAVENERLRTEVESQVEEVRASRIRIVLAGDAERQRLERDLHDGAQQRLVSLALALQLARQKLGDDAQPDVRLALEDAAEAANAGLTELRDLARGIHPQVLTQAGLGAAINSLAYRSTVRVAVDVEADARYSSGAEAAAYFVVSEALANVAKYAHATQATVRTSWSDGCLVVEISDDGVGGADPGLGTGLLGLGDRVEAIGGTFEIVSPLGRGTRLVARIPTSTMPIRA